jgi:TolA-binding protein
MATAKTATKTVAKKAVKKVIKKAPESKPVETFPRQMHAMTNEVKEWIDQAMSRIRHLQGQVDRLNTENNELKSYKKWAEHRILRSEAE